MRWQLGALQLAPVLGDALAQPTQVGQRVLVADELAFVELIAALRAGLHQHGFTRAADLLPLFLKLGEEVMSRGAGHDGSLSGGRKPTSKEQGAGFRARQWIGWNARSIGGTLRHRRVESASASSLSRFSRVTYQRPASLTPGMSPRTSMLRTVYSCSRSSAATSATNSGRGRSLTVSGMSPSSGLAVNLTAACRDSCRGNCTPVRPKRRGSLLRAALQRYTARRRFV